jgi:hypothetical protein
MGNTDVPARIQPKRDRRAQREESAMYIGAGTLVIILLIVLIVYFLRRA